MREAGPEARAGSLVGLAGDSGGACPLVDQDGSWGLWMQGPRGVLGLVLCPCVWSQDLGTMVGRAMFRGGCGQPVCWWVGLCPCPVSCLAPSISAFVPTGWWEGVALGPQASELEGGLKNGTCQHQCPRGNISIPKWLLLVSVSPG